MPTVSQAMFARLSGFGALSSLVGSRIYPGSAPQDQVTPFVAFMRIDEDQESAFDQDADILETLFEVVAVGATYDECEAVYEAVRDATRRYHGTIGGVEVADMLHRGGDGPLASDDPPSYEATQRVAVRYRKP